MLLQLLWSLFTAHPRRTVNALALFFALAGGMLLLMTRIREQRAIARMLASDVDARVNESAMIDAPTQRLNQFFYGFASAALLFGLLLSEVSTQL